MGVGSYAGGGAIVAGGAALATCVVTIGAGGVDVGSKVVAVAIPAPEGGGAEATIAGVGVGGVGVATAISTGALRPGGVQPGGGSNALFGSTRRDSAGVAATTTGAGDGVEAAVSVGGGKSVVDVATVDVAGAGGGAAIVAGGATVAGGRGAKAAGCAVATVVNGGAALVSTGAVWPGGTHPGGGSNALFGSTGRTGAAATVTGAGGVAACAGGGAAALSVGGAMAVAVTGAGGGAAAGAEAVEDAGEDVPGEEADRLAVPATWASSALRCASWRSVSARAFRSVSRCALASSSSCAFCPPLPATTDPICVPPRVSSIGATLVSYWRPVPAGGRLADTATDCSAPGRT